MEFAIQSYDIEFKDIRSSPDQNDMHNILYFLQHFNQYFNHIAQSLKAGSLKYDPVFQLIESADQLAAFNYRMTNFLNISLAMCNDDRRQPSTNDQNAKRQCIRSGW